MIVHCVILDLLTLVSDAYTKCRSRWEVKIRSRIKESRHRKSNSMQIEKEKKSRNPNPNPNPRGKGTPDLLGLCVTHGRTCAGRMSAALAKRALHSKQPSPFGTPGARARAREGLGHHRQAARRRRALARAERVRRRGGRRRRRPRFSPAAMDARVAAASRGGRKGRGE